MYMVKDLLFGLYDTQAERHWCLYATVLMVGMGDNRLTLSVRLSLTVSSEGSENYP